MAERVPIPKKVRFEVFKRDSFTCQYCGRSSPNVILEVDHIVPVAEGGNNDIANLITSCHDCNIGKGGIPLNVSAKDYVYRRSFDRNSTQRRRVTTMVNDIAKSCVFRPMTNDEKKVLNDLIRRYGADRVQGAVANLCLDFGGPYQMREAQWEAFMGSLELVVKRTELKWVWV